MSKFTVLMGWKVFLFFSHYVVHVHICVCVLGVYACGGPGLMSDTFLIVSSPYILRPWSLT